jgi:hypothetical protein
VTRGAFVVLLLHYAVRVLMRVMFMLLMMVSIVIIRGWC